MSNNSSYSSRLDSDASNDNDVIFVSFLQDQRDHY